MTCALCGTHEGDPWIAVTVLEDDPVAGLICSTGCLIDYAARVAGFELEEET